LVPAAEEGTWEAAAAAHSRIDPQGVRKPRLSGSFTGENFEGSLEPNKAKADVLYRIADEADQDVLCTFDRTNFGSNRKPGPPGNMS